MRISVALVLVLLGCNPSESPAEPCPTPEGLTDECPEVITEDAFVFGALNVGEIDIWEVAGEGRVTVNVAHLNEFGEIDCTFGFDIEIAAALPSGETLTRATGLQCPALIFDVAPGLGVPVTVENLTGVATRYALEASYLEP